MLWGERIAWIILDEEMKRAGFFRMDKRTEARLAAYLEEPELRERFLADAAKISGELETELSGALYMLIPADYDVEPCVEGIKVRPFFRERWVQ